jgi:hypothetical protein
MYFGHSWVSATVTGVVAPAATLADLAEAVVTNAGFLASPKHITVTVTGPR